MPDSETQSDFLERSLELLEHDDHGALQTLLEGLHPAELADLLESLPPRNREPVWAALSAERRGPVLLELHDEVRAGLIEAMSADELVAAAQDLDAEDLAYLFDDLPDAATSAILGALTREDRRRLRQTLAYPEDTAGRLLDAEVISIRPSVTVDVVLRYLRRHDSLPRHTDALMVVDKHNTFLGVLPLERLLTARLGRTVAELMVEDADVVTVDAPAREVAQLFERHDLVTVPVLDAERRLLGRITVDEVVDVIHEEADQTLLNLAGLDQEDDLFAPVLSSARRRAVWLGINLATAFLAAWVIGLFEATLQQIVALAVLMPVVASM
ncbi:MAG: magnesium transporter, partial [Candidatus Competibacterales bacterium]|nr:magnesium transporter [Candidatus Competibacterales bacterium]